MGSDSLFGVTDRKCERLKRRSDPRPTLCRSGRRFLIPPWRRTNRSWLFAERGRVGVIGLLKRGVSGPKMMGPALGTVSPLCLSTNADKWNGPAGRRDSGQRSKNTNSKGAAPPAAEVWESFHPPRHIIQWGRPFRASPLHSQQVDRSPTRKAARCSRRSGDSFANSRGRYLVL